MKAKIINKDHDNLLIEWEDEEYGFGQLIINWDNKLGKFICDSEHMGIHTILKIIKAIA